jgi:uncharacterized protein YdeI (YjbR/CyaY-like superfamily)
MSKNSAKTFRAVLERAGTGPYWVLARLPMDLKKAWPQWKTRRVRGAINEFEFRTALLPAAEGKGYALVVNKKMQKGAGGEPGDAVTIRVEPDMDEPVILEPKELTKALRGDRQLRKWFDAMSPSMRKGIGFFVDQAKSAQTRQKRAEQMAETVMLAMEGEVEAPPILRIAFERQPLARQGWEAMTPKQRQRHLLGIFYPQTVPGRARRATKAVEECLRVARAKAPKE